jgi:hypothetical protein
MSFSSGVFEGVVQQLGLLTAAGSVAALALDAGWSSLYS